MTSNKAMLQERKDLEKFARFFAFKAVQVIVQSRLGEKIKMRSKPNPSPLDWFNLPIRDIAEVTEEVKKAVGKLCPAVGFSVCVEISLKTVDGGTLVLEMWQLSMNEQENIAVRSISTVYNHMCLLLKSLVCVTRVTPAYKLSSRQGPDTYVICYRIYTGDPQYNLLGDGYQFIKLGQVGTVIGAYNVTVAFRTKLTITPQEERECPFLVKSDHFKPDLSPKRLHQPPTVHAASPVEPNSLEVLSTKEKAAGGISCNHHGVEDKDCKVCTCEADSVHHINGCSEQFASFTDGIKIGAFAPPSSSSEVPTGIFIPELPFASLLNPLDKRNRKESEDDTRLTNKCATDDNANMAASDTTIPGLSNPGTDNSRDAGEGTVTPKAVDCDDFVMVELTPAFANPEDTNCLGSFFRECQAAPQLLSFSNQPTLEEQVLDIGQQLALFETSMHDFDEFVDSLCQTESVK